jgi:dihydropteroate synthase
MLFHPQTTLNCNGTLLDLSEPIVMGILNVTTDSFFDGGQFMEVDKCLTQVEKMLSEGAKIIDVGAASSRPGAKMIAADEELAILEPVIQAILKQSPDVILSCDTYNSRVAAAVIELGVKIINDISGGAFDENLWKTVAQYRVPYILMHNRGNPETMQQHTDYEDITKEILNYFIQSIEQLRALGIKDIVVDLGFGFAKTLDQNYELMRNMHLFQMLEVPILTGISRKSMIYKFLETTPQQSLNGTTVLHIIALQKGSKILRVHDVREAVEAIKLFQKIENVG